MLQILVSVLLQWNQINSSVYEKKSTILHLSSSSIWLIQTTLSNVQLQLTQPSWIRPAKLSLWKVKIIFVRDYFRPTLCHQYIFFSWKNIANLQYWITQSNENFHYDRRLYLLEMGQCQYHWHCYRNVRLSLVNRRRKSTSENVWPTYNFTRLSDH